MISISSPQISQAAIKKVTQVLQTGQLIQGELVAEFEAKFAAYCGTKYAIAFNSGTAAIHAGLYALGIGPRDEVITAPFTFVATANPILMQRAKIVFADIKEEDYMLDVKEVKNKINPHSKAIIPVDLYGLIHDSKALKKVTQGKNILVLEDACQAIGAKRNQKMAGTHGNVAAFSLYATKNITCCEGGVLTTNNPRVAKLAKRFRHHGQDEQQQYEYLDLGYNYRMTEIAAAIALEQLKKVDQLNEQRISNASLLSQGLSAIKGLITPAVPDNTRHVFHQYTIRLTNKFSGSRDELIKYLQAKNISTRIYYPKPLHLHSHFMSLGYKAGDFPIAEKLASQVLSLPVHPGLGKKEMEKIIKAIIEYVKSN